MIPDDVVEQIRESADIVQLIGEHVNLRRVGADWRGPCPFHQGKSRNFSVSARKRMYYCFVCHEGGDVFQFLVKRLGMDWPSAVKLVAGKVGIEVREVDARRQPDEKDPREPLWEANAAAADFFRRALWEDAAGNEARDYLAGRHVTREVADRFSIGFAPRDGAAMRGYLTGLGIDERRQLEAGLLARREEETEVRARFRGRLMFPIFDVAGHACGFGGRLLGPGEPKYLNSADGPAFTKGRLLYGLNWARHAIRKEDRVLLVEGYFDVLRLIAAGLEAAVAPLGTALTEAQAAMLARYTRNVFLLYDSDAPGLKATFRSGDALLQHGVSARVVSLPEGDDPDTFVDRHGLATMEAHLAAGIDVFERKIQILERRGWFSDLHRKREALDRLLPTIRCAVDPITRDLYLGRASEVSGVEKSILERELANESGGRRGAAASSGTAREPDDGPPVPGATAGARRRPGPDRGPAAGRGARPTRGAGAERELLRVMLGARAYVARVAERVEAVQFRDNRYRALFDTVVRLGSEAMTDEIAGALPDAESVAALQELLAAPNAIIDPRRTVDDCVAQLKIRDIDERLAALDREIPIAAEREKNDLIREVTMLRDERTGLGGGVGSFRKLGRPRAGA